MTCEECEKVTSALSRVAYYRLGNKDIDYGNIGLIGCDNHVRLAIERLRDDKFV